MAESYGSILKSSQEYNNLKEALEYMNDVCKSVDRIKNVVSSNITGKEAEDAKGRLLSLYAQANNYVKKIKEMIKKLEENAAKGDAVLAQWQAKASAREAYKFEFYDIVELNIPVNPTYVPRYYNEIYHQARGKVVEDGMIPYRAIKSTIRVDSAGIDPSSGYIEVKLKEELVTHEYTTKSEQSPSVALICTGPAISGPTERPGEVLYFKFDGSQICG